MRIRLATGLALVVLTAARLTAHDFWLSAGTWTPAPGTALSIAAGIGERFPTRTSFKSRPDWLDEWRILGEAGDVPVTRDFKPVDLVLATDVTLPAPGAYLGVMSVTARTIEMTGKEFTEYLQEESIDAAIAARQVAGEADKPRRIGKATG